MVFLRSSTGLDASAAVRGAGVVLRPLTMADYAPWAEIRALSREHLVPWEPAWARDELTRSAFRRRLRHYQREAREDLGYAYGLFEEASEALIGGLTLSNVRRGVTQSASLGYWLGRPHVGRGRMSAAVRAIIPHAFGTLRLHRIEAATMPDNAASMRVLEGCGFAREGFARRYLKINGVWQDHILFALLAEDGGKLEELA